ncbi:hypothetical protein JQ615_40855 [Bradyrhizobium jicamae]|uniref:Oligosaccharide repeat unit polymerase n=1 Tax=Bradyrhizobium jicamae TaxID=280332 RepID=A0ABS5FY59_9BRAD|nr:hypothetical protein [Bradyrhizobium jicamae]MBR0801698.1 hypothetical protein [Bradyrhizobium jicamae]
MPQLSSWTINLVFLACLAFVLLHWAVLGGIPVIQATKSTDYLAIAKLRQLVTEQGNLLNYGSSFLIRVIFPLLVLRYLQTRQYWIAFIVGVVGVFYGLSLLQKSYPIFVLAPAMVYLAFTQWRAAAVCAIVVGLSIVALALITNASLRSVPNTTVALRTATVVVTSLAQRILVTPGQVVSDWLNAFPAIYPFEHGCGYRFLSSMLGCDFVNNSVLMFQHYFPENVARGLRGTYNAAHFAEDYANFGPPGFIMSGLLAGGVLFAAAWAGVGRDTATIVAINFPSIASLSSSALQTTLVSGGWIIMVALSLILLPKSEAVTARSSPAVGPADREW